MDNSQSRDRNKITIFSPKLSGPVVHRTDRDLEIKNASPNDIEIVRELEQSISQVGVYTPDLNIPLFLESLQKSASFGGPRRTTRSRWMSDHAVELRDAYRGNAATIVSATSFCNGCLRGCVLAHARTVCVNQEIGV